MIYKWDALMKADQESEGVYLGFFDCFEALITFLRIASRLEVIVSGMLQCMGGS